MSKYNLEEFTYEKKISILFSLNEEERKFIECTWHLYIDDDYIIGNTWNHFGDLYGIAFNYIHTAGANWQNNDSKIYENPFHITDENKKYFCEKVIDKVLYEYFEYKYEQQLKQLKHDTILHNIRKAIK